MRSVPGSRGAAFLTALALLAGCAGGAGSGSLGSTIPKQTNGATGSVRFSVVVPQKTATSGRSPAYVSPATQSMTVTVYQGANNLGTATVGLTASSTGCTSSLASTTCTLTISSLNAGSYTGSITTYDGANGTGNALSTEQNVAFTVTSNQSTLVPLTLSGIPTAIKVLNAGTNAVDVLAQDADGNFIIGAGAPTFTASASSGPAVVTVVQPTASHPNLISFVQASPVVYGTESLSISASYPVGQSNTCGMSGAVCSLSSAITATALPPMAMAASYTNGFVFGYSLPLSSPTQAPTIALSLGADDFLLAEDNNGNVFSAAYASPATVWKIPPPYSTATVANTLGGDDPYQMAVGPNGDLALANDGGGTGGSLYSPPYSGAPTALTSGVTTPTYGVAFDASSNLYFGNEGASTLTMLAPPYTGTPVTVSTTSVPYGLTISGNTLFVGESSAVDVFSLPLTSTSVPIATLSSGVKAAYRMALDGSGNLWVSNDTGGSISKGTIEEFTKPFSTGEAPAVTINLPVGTSTSITPWGIAFDSSGNLYVANSAGGTANGGGLLEFTPPITSASTPEVAIETANFNDLYDLVITPSAFSVTP